MKNLKMTLEQFAEKINEADGWEIEFYEIILANGWADNTDESDGICSSDTDKLKINRQGRAAVYYNYYSEATAQNNENI